MAATDNLQLGRYQLVRKLATGGMAEVFLAKAIGPGGFEKALVIKRILPGLTEDPEFVSMFLHEARLAAQLNHPNIVQIFDFGEVSGTYYLAMEFIDGPNLRSVLRKSPNKQVPAQLAARIIAQACEGLAYAHEFCDPATGEPLGLIHRDVSADNLLIARNGAVKVVDFGVAKVQGQASTSSAGTVKGKIAYMPPEQILGDADKRADVYALGVILYEMAAGTKPYDSAPDVQLITNIIKHEPVPLLTRAPEVPIEYVMIVEKAMARDVTARYQDCRELAVALDDFVSNSGERVGTVQLAQLVANVVGPPTSATGTGLKAVGAEHTGTGSRRTAQSGSNKVPGLATPAQPWPATPRPGSGSHPTGAPKPTSGAHPAVGAQATGSAGASGAKAASGDFPAVSPPSIAPATASTARSGSFPAIGADSSTGRSGSFPALGAPQPGPAMPPLGASPPAPVAPTPFAGFFVQPPAPRPGSGPVPSPAMPFASTPSPSPSTQVLKVKPSEPNTAEARAHLVLADAEAMRTYEAGPPLGAAPELDAVRDALEKDEGVHLFARFPRHATKLLQANPQAQQVLGERIVGAVEGLLLTESYGRLALMLERLEADAATDDNARWVFEIARSAFATPDQANRLAARLREGPPADAAGLGRFLRFFGGEYAPMWLAITEAMDVSGSREALLIGLCELAGRNAAPFLARVLEERPRRLAEFVYLLEKGRGSDRQRAFRTVLGRRDPAQRREVMAGMARAGTDDACNMLAGALGERTDAARMTAIELLVQHFPERVFKLVEPLLEPEGYQARSPAERVAIWKAVGASPQPEALAAIADVLKQKPSLLARSRVDALKLDALEGLAINTSPQGQELLKAVAADRTQPGAVTAAAERHLTRGTFTLEAPKFAGELRRFERTASTPRDIVLDLMGLALAHRLLDVRHPAYELAFTRLRARLETVLRKERGAAFSVSGRAVSCNGVPAYATPDGDAEVQRAAALFASRGISSFTFAGASVAVEELQHLVRWLSEGSAAEAPSTPSIQRVHAANAPDRPARPVVPSVQTSDASKDAMVRYVDLVFLMRGWLAAQKTNPALPMPDVRQALHELAGLMHTRTVRFHGLTPYTLGRDAVIFHHCNVLVLSLALGAELGLSRARLNELAEFAFGSDVGMFELTDETLHRTGELTPDDKRALLQARRTSAWYPFARLGDAPPSAAWASVVVEHGLDWGVKDDKGAITERNDVGLLGCIVSLAKTYDALTSRRSFRAAMAPEQALEVMAQKVNHRFRPEVLPLFVRMVKRQGVRPLPRR